MGRRWDGVSVLRAERKKEEELEGSEKCLEAWYLIRGGVSVSLDRRAEAQRDSGNCSDGILEFGSCRLPRMGAGLRN